MYVLRTFTEENMLLKHKKIGLKFLYIFVQFFISYFNKCSLMLGPSLMKNLYTTNVTVYK